MTIPTITEYLGVVPDRREQSAEAFTQAAITWTDYQADTFIPSINTTVEAMNLAVIAVNDDVALSVDAAATASSSANYQGDWFLGAEVLKGQSWSHDGLLWRAKQNSLVEPAEGAFWLLINAAKTISTKTSESAQDFIDSFALKIFQSPTDGLTEISTRTLEGGEVYEVRKVSDGALAAIYSDKNSANEIEQNGTINVSGSDGVVGFYIADGDYTITVNTVSAGFGVGAKGIRYNSITSAILTVQDLAPTLSIRAFDPDGLLDSDVDHTQIIQDSWNFSSVWGFKIIYHAQRYIYSTLDPRTGMNVEGSGKSDCFLITSSTATALDPVLWTIKKADDGNRARSIKIKGFYIGSATSSVATAQDNNPNLGGLCLAACEDSRIEDVRFAGFGQGGMVLARAANGVEGLGFVNTEQDGNYNIGVGLYFVSCGKYNDPQAALWLKYQANSNKFYGVFGKAMNSAHTVGLSYANDNLIIGGSAEACKGVANFKPMLFGGSTLGIVRANTISDMRAEQVTGDAYLLTGGDNCNKNYILRGHTTSVSGEIVNKSAAPNNYVDIQGYFDSPATSSDKDFPPTSTADHADAMQRFNSIRADNQLGALYRTTEKFNEPDNYVEVIDYNTRISPSAGEVMSSWGVHCNDSSSGGQGVNATIRAQTRNTLGALEWVVSAGRESDGLTDVLKISTLGVEILSSATPLIMSSPDGTRYQLTPPNGGGAATWVAV